MENKRFLTAQDVMEMLDVSLSYAYKLIRRLNAELESEGFVTIKGRVSTQYFMERIYGLSTDKACRSKENTDSWITTLAHFIANRFRIFCIGNR